MKRIVFVLLLSAVALCSRPVRADEPETDYVLGPDDVIEIIVANHSDLGRTVTILPDGKFAFPEVGEVKAAGKRPKELASFIRTELEKTRNNVEVTVSVKEIHSLRVRVIGGVRAPGAFDLKPGWHIFDLVAAAGGLSAKPARITGRIVRNGASVLPLDMEQAMSSPSSSANLALQRDDLVLLDEIEPVRFQIHVMGQVNKPGAYEADNVNILSLISLAGNPTDRAALTQAYVLRGTTRIPLDLRPILVEGKASSAVTSFRLLPGDLLFIPEIEKRFAVMGQVARSGYYPFPEKGQVTVIDALNLAGGQPQNGDTSKAGIIRMVDGKATVVHVNVDAMLKKGNLAKNVPLQPDDILFIPARGEHRFNWSDVLAPISALSLFGFRLGR